MIHELHVIRKATIERKTNETEIVLSVDLDGSGKISIVTGGFYSYPPFDRMDRLTLWRPKATP